MSTANTESSSAPQPAPAEDQPACRTLAALADRLMSLTAEPSLAEINAWVREVRVERAELEPFVQFKDTCYARRRVVRGEHAELLIICWRPGQRTPIHDHDGSYGTVRVCEGVMWETTFEMEDGRGLAYLTGREWRAGETTAGADIPDIHQIGNPDISGQNLITLHLYAPPLTSLNIYRLGHTDSEFSPSAEIE